MKVLCSAKAFFDSIIYDEDRAAFTEEYGKPENFRFGIRVHLPNEKTLSQLGAVWRDFEIVGRLLHCNQEMVYVSLLRAEEFQDIWLDRVNGKWVFHTLSMLDKEKTAKLITRYREFLQAKVNLEYGEYVEIDWSRKDKDKEVG